MIRDCLKFCRDTDADTSHTQALLSELGLAEVTSAEHRSVIRYVCSALSLRAAQLVCASTSRFMSTLLCRHLKQIFGVYHRYLSELVVLTKRVAQDRVTIAIDGSLFRYNHKIQEHMTSLLQHFVPETTCKLIDAPDGSGRGAAFVAAVATRLEKDSQP